jgi:hypothetical protein
MKVTFVNLIEISIAAFLVTMGLFYAVLPSIVVNLDPLIKTYAPEQQISESSNLIGWIGQLILFVIMLGFIILFSGQYKFKNMFLNLLRAFIMCIGPLCVISYSYVFFFHPEFLNNLALADELLIFFQYPGQLAIYLNNPQLIWMITSGMELFLFINLFYKSAYILQ